MYHKNSEYWVDFQPFFIYSAVFIDHLLYAGLQRYHGAKGARQTQAFPLGAYISICPGDILTQMYIKNNVCKIDLMMSALKSAFPSGILTFVNGTSIPSISVASNLKLSSLFLFLS